MHVLLIEDNPGDAVLIEQMLPGVAVTWHDSVEDAADDLRGGGYDIVLLDLHVPPLEGADTYEAVRRIWPKGPIVVITGTADPKVVAQLARRGVRDVISKDATGGEIQARLAAVLGCPTPPLPQRTRESGSHAARVAAQIRAMTPKEREHT